FTPNFDEELLASQISPVPWGLVGAGPTGHWQAWHDVRGKAEMAGRIGMDNVALTVSDDLPIVLFFAGVTASFARDVMDIIIEGI
ncbi:MAG: hypothetical protein ABIN58_00125, partial [candidate division WOR-3 bacterium]